MIVMSAKGKPTSMGKLLLNFQSPGSEATTSASTVLLVSSVKTICTETSATPRNEAVPFTANWLLPGDGICPVTATDKGPFRFR